MVEIWASKLIPISELIPYNRNPRVISEERLEKLKAQIIRQGFRTPLCLNTDKTLLAGHQRLKVLAGILPPDFKIPCTIAPRKLSKAEIKEIVATDNISWGGWDWKMMEKDFKFEQLLDWGFDKSEIKFKEVIKPVKGEDDAPAPSTAEPVAKLGDVWLLGNNRLLCGDATSLADVEKLMGGGVAEMVFTDPPYRMEAQGGSNQPIGRAAAKLGKAIEHLCDFDPKAFLRILPEAFKKNTLNAYIFCNKDLVPDYLQWAVAAGYNFNILFWKKPNAIPLGGQHRPDVEYLLFFRKSAHWNNAVEGASYSKCLEFKRESSTPHPTMKPVAMIENQLLISSQQGSIVVDFFLGSGSTIIACEKHERKCYGLELDPRYCDVIIKRWQTFTGKTAILESSGEKYDDLLGKRPHAKLHLRNKAQ